MQIKFRAWDKENKRMVNANWRMKIDMNGNILWTIDHYDGNLQFKEAEEIDGNDRFVLMQFTGLKDKNGIEIYESDYIRSETGRICEVVWFQSSEHVGWDLKAINAEGTAPGYMIWDTEVQGWEVVGNKFKEV